MATYNKGILGSFSGTIGNVVGASWRGIAYMRSKPTKVSNPNTEAQQTQRQKFRLIAEFLRILKPVIHYGFLGGTPYMTAVNQASSYNIKNAITGTFPHQEIDYPYAALSRGDLTQALDPMATAVLGSEIEFSWEDNSGSGSAKETDRAMLVAYSPLRKRAFYTTGTEALRADGSYNMVLPMDYQGDTMECYIAFVSEDGKSSSDSQYLGAVEII